MADLLGVTVEEVKADGVQTSLVALHVSGGAPEDRADLIRLATGESFVRPTAFTRVTPDPNAAGVLFVDIPLEDLTGPQQIDSAMGIRPSNADANAEGNAVAKAKPVAKAPPVFDANGNVVPKAPPAKAASSSSNARLQNAPRSLNDIPAETTHLMCETLQMHKLSRNGPVNKEVSKALTLMDCGKELKKAWNDLDMYVVNDSTDEMTKIEEYGKIMARRLLEAQLALAEAIYKREWSDECPIISVLLPGTRSGGMSGCRFDHPDEHSNGPMSSLRLRMNSLDIGPVSNRVNECMMETGWFAMTKAERMFLTKGNWQIEWKLAPCAKENVLTNLVNVYDWVMLPLEIGEQYYLTGEIDLSRFPCHQMNGSFSALSAMRKTVQWFCQDALNEGAEYQRLCFVVRRRDVNEAKRVWTEASSSKRMKLDNYFNRQFTDHISTQNATLVENDGDLKGKWIWRVSD